jgi:hypothetical protein
METYVRIFPGNKESWLLMQKNVFKWYVERAYQILFQLKVKIKIWDYQKKWKCYQNNCNYKNTALYATLQNVNPE